MSHVEARNTIEIRANLDTLFFAAHRSPYVSGANGGLLCYGDADMDRPVALVARRAPSLLLPVCPSTLAPQVVVDEAKVSRFAEDAGVARESFEALCEAPAVVAEVLRSLVAAGKSGKLGSNEILAAVLLLPGTGAKDATPPRFDDPWTPENGMLTASNKLQRKPIVKAYGAGGKFEKLKALGIK